MIFSNLAASLWRMIRRRLPESRSHRFVADYLIGGRYRRIYHYHIRKTAGTSLDAAFWRLAGVDFYEFGIQTRICKNDMVMVRGARKLIESGNYFFASSHIPAHALKLPEDTFTITLLRDPLDRLLSYYRYLLWARDNPQSSTREPFRKELAPEIAYVANGFAGFLENTPQEHLLRQLFMFSGDYNAAEAAERISGCSAVGFTESFDQCIENISQLLDLPLKVHEERRFHHQFKPSTTEMNEARDILVPEYRLLEEVRQKLGIADHSLPERKT